MKLNYKRTILVGFAFFLITAFWQAYDTIPITLTNKFGMSQTASGFIMTLDNILALFMLPLFGAISDKCRSKHGKRKPFILLGTVVAVVAFLGLTLVDNAQLNKIRSVSTVDDPAALSVIYEAKADATLKDPEGNSYVLQDLFTKEQFTAIRSTDAADDNDMNSYTRYVVPARQSYANDITKADPGAMIAFIAVLLCVLIAMSTFRSPAVALMPDVTVKPLRSKANAVINLMGTAGGILVLLTGMVVGTGKAKNAMMSYTGFFGIVIIIMVASLVIFMWKVKETKWAGEMEEQSVALGLEEAQSEADGNRKLSKSQMTSLILILLSVALWYFGYNAVTSKYAVYANNILGMDHNTTLLIAQGAAILAYLPAGMVASKIGRRRTVLGGVILLTAAFFLASFMRANSSVLQMNILFATAGIGWATINVNSFPMVVEMCTGSNVGKYTGYYYTASMAAQAITPTLSGALMDSMGMTVLFPYAAVFVALAFVTMLFVKHGDAKIQAKKGLEGLAVED